MMRYGVFVLLAALAAAAPRAAAPIRVMLLDGESGGPWHKWQLTTPVLKTILDGVGLFQVDVVTAPPKGGDFSAFMPKFSDYRVVVLNYDAPDERWGAEVRHAFEQITSRAVGEWWWFTRPTTRLPGGRPTTR